MKIGDLVRMSARGRDQYGNWTNNPHDATGTVFEIIPRENHRYRVEWPNGYTNVYREGELELAIDHIGVPGYE